MAYIDTSVLAAYYCPESLSRSAQKRLSEVEEPHISPLVEVELYSAVAAKVRAGDIDRSQAGQILDIFRKHLGDGFYRVVPLVAAEYALACDWLGRFASPLRAADAIHLAAAFTNGLTIITADKALARSARQFAVPCELIE